MTWDITFVGFVTYENNMWGIALVQKEKKKSIWGHSNRIQVRF